MNKQADPEISFERKVEIGRALSERLSGEALSLSKDFPDTDVNRRSIARAFLITTAQLSGQIIKAASQGMLSLSIVGLRATLEQSINANFVFDHPDHQKDYDWIDELCRDSFRRTNDLKEKKNKLGGVGLKERATAIKRPDLYEINYASLSDYAHIVVRPVFLNDQERFQRLTVDAISHALCDLIGVIDSIAKCFELSWDVGLEAEVIEYRDKFESEAIPRDKPPADKV